MVCVRMVEVDVLAFLRRHVTGVLVIGILGDDYYASLKLFRDCADNGCLS